MRQEQMKRGTPKTFELELHTQKLRINCEPELTLDKALERNILFLGHYTCGGSGSVTWRNMAQPDLIISGETRPEPGAHYLGHQR